jgi:hypothetical protein
LTELGYGSVTEKLESGGYENPLNRIKGINIARKLTAGGDPLHSSFLVTMLKPFKEWNKIKDDVIAIMEEQQEKIAKAERRNLMLNRATILKDVLEKYAANLPINHPAPGMGDIADFPAFKTILLDTPLDNVITPGSFEDAVSLLPALSAEWRASKELELLEILGPHTSLADLQLAATRFRCMGCSHDIPYPRIIVHQCLRQLNCDEQPANQREMDFSACQEILGRIWSPTRCVKSTVEQKMNSIILQCGLDPATATHQELMSSDVILEIISEARHSPICRQFSDIPFVVRDSAT